MHRVLRVARDAARTQTFRNALFGTLAIALGISGASRELPVHVAGSKVVPVPHEKAAPNEGAAPHVPTDRTAVQTGKASWYGRAFQGKRTANGESFDMNRLTCAHRTLPLGSWVRVTNLRTRLSIFVRVNDRGPVAPDRLVDLSYAAAAAVHMDGTTRVRLERVRANDPVLMRAMLAQLKLPLGQLRPMGLQEIAAR